MSGRSGQALRRGLHRIAWAVLICAALGAFLNAVDPPRAAAEPAPSPSPSAPLPPGAPGAPGVPGVPGTQPGGAQQPQERDDPKPGTGLLGELDEQKVNGVPISNYEITADPGGITDWDRKLLIFLTNGIFGLVKLIIEVVAWLLGWGLKFGPAKTLLSPAQTIADAYKTQVVDRLGLPSLLLTLAGFWCGLLVLRGRGARGWGEMGLSVLISALSATTLLAPAGLLMGDDGLMGSTRDTATALASITATGGASDKADPSARMQQIMLETFVAKPHQMLQFGAVFDGNGKVPAKCRQAYADGVSGKKPPGFQLGDMTQLTVPFGQAPAADRREDPPGYFMEHAGGTCKDYADYHAKPSWDRLFGAVLLLVAAGLVAVLILIMVGALLISICAMACYAITGHVVAVIAIMPGGARGLLWRWLGGVTKTVLVICAVVVVLPLMTVGIDALMKSADDQGLMVKFALMDVVVAAGLVFHRRLLRMSSLAGHRLAGRMEWARIGGSRGAGSGYSTYGLLENMAVGGGGGVRAGNPLDGPSAGGAYRSVRSEIDRVVSPVTATAGKARRAWVGDPDKNRRVVEKQKDAGVGAFKQKMYGSRGGRVLWRTAKATKGTVAGVGAVAGGAAVVTGGVAYGGYRGTRWLVDRGWHRHHSSEEPGGSGERRRDRERETGRRRWDRRRTPDPDREREARRRRQDRRRAPEPGGEREAGRRSWDRRRDRGADREREARRRRWERRRRPR